FVALAKSISPKKMYARIPVTANGPSARLNQRCAGAAARLGGRENCKAFCAGQAATQTIHALHSADRICIRRSTGRPAGQARAHFPQSMQASESRRILTGL